MRSLTVPAPGDLVCFRPLARAALQAGWAPETLTWVDAGRSDLWAQTSPPDTDAPVLHPAPRISREALDLLETVLRHRDPARLALSYRLLWRINHGEPGLMALASDPDVRALDHMARAVRRCIHKMKAFLRFREVQENAGEVRYVAWFEPEHRVLVPVSAFLQRRFTGMAWSVLTPEASAHWDGHTLQFDAGLPHPPRHVDAIEDLWRTYYAHIFNPARLNPAMMRKEMPQKYWKHLPEAHLIPSLMQQASLRTGQMIEQPPTTPRKRIRPRPEPEHSPE